MRIRTRIILAVLPVVVAVNVFYAYYLVEKERETALADLRTSIAETSRLLKVVVAAPLYDGDVEQLGTDLDSFFSDRHMIELVLEEYDGNLRLTRERQPAANLGTTLATRVVVTRGPDQLGEVRATYSTALIELDLQRSRNRIMFLAGLLVLLLSAVIYLVANGLTRRIDRLNLAARAIADGQLDQEVETGGARELVSLAESFVRMRDSIRAKMADLAEKNVLLRQQIAEREKLEGQLVQSQKMEAVGRLAGGIAHDFNNLLTVIIGYCELILGEADLQPTLRADLEEIRQAGASAAALTRQLLAFSRKQVLQPRVLDLNRARGQHEPNADAPHRRGRGAGDAPGGRAVARPGGPGPDRAGHHEPGRQRPRRHAGRRQARPSRRPTWTSTTRTPGATPTSGPGRTSCCRSATPGTGMDAETLARIFEPFFTTKGREGDRPRALHRVRDREAERRPPVGPERARPRHDLPDLPAAGGEPPGAGGGSRPGPRLGASRRDDPGRRGLRRGEAPGPAGPHAVRLQRAGGPERRGGAQRRREAPGPDPPHRHRRGDARHGRPALADRLRSARPEMRVLFMSGYTEDAIVTKGVLQGGIDFLAKPFTPFALEQKVKEILGSPVPGGVS